MKLVFTIVKERGQGFGPAFFSCPHIVVYFLWLKVMMSIDPTF